MARSQCGGLGLFNSLIFLTVLSIAPLITFGQSVVAQSTPSTQPEIPVRSSSSISASEKPAATLDDRLKALEEELQRQNAALTDMSAIIAEQQRVIETLTAKTTGSDPTSGDQKSVVMVAAAVRVFARSAVH